MAGDTPDLDWVADDLRYGYVADELILDALVGRGNPTNDECGCCASRLRGRNRRSRIGAGRARVHRICVRCDVSPSRLRLPRGWTA